MEFIFSIFKIVKCVLSKFGITEETDNEFAWVDWVMTTLFGAEA